MFLWDAEFKIFEIAISLEIILYSFIAIGGLAFIIYLVNLLFGKNKFKKTNLKDAELVKSKILEKNKESLDKEIISIVRDRKERYK